MEMIQSADFRLWQAGDLISIAHYPEKRLIVALEENHIIVIAESGWYNRYQVPSELPLLFHRATNLVYTFTGREQLHRDFLKGLFTEYFRP